MPPKSSFDNNSPNLKKILPEKILGFLGRNPAIGLESEEDFDKLFTSLIVELDYRDTLEIFDIRDIAEIHWEINRLRDIRRAAIEKKLPLAATQLLYHAYRKTACANPANEEHDYIDEEFVEQEFTKMFRAADQGSASARRVIEDLAKSEKVTNRMLQHDAYCKALTTVTHLDEAIVRLEHRRDLVIRKFENRRKNLSAMTRGLVRSSEAVDATFVGDSDPKKNGST